MCQKLRRIGSPLLWSGGASPNVDMFSIEKGLVYTSKTVDNQCIRKKLHATFFATLYVVSSLFPTRPPDDTRRDKGGATSGARLRVKNALCAVPACGQSLRVVGARWFEGTTHMSLTVVVRSALCVYAGGAWVLVGSQSLSVWHKGKRCGGGLFDTSSSVERITKKQSDKKDITGNVDNDFLNQNVSIIILIMILVIVANLFENKIIVCSVSNLKKDSSVAFGHVFEEL